MCNPCKTQSREPFGQKVAVCVLASGGTVPGSPIDLVKLHHEPASHFPRPPTPGLKDHITAT